MKTVSRLLVAGVVSLLPAACGENDTAGSTGGTSGQASLAGATAAGSAGSPGVAGSTSGGTAGAGGGSTAGGGPSAGAAGEPMTPEALWEATYDLCDEACFLEKSACPEIELAVCVGTCRQQADNYLASGTCARELYVAYSCVTTTLEEDDLTCIPNGVEFRGCQSEIGAYDTCVGN
jgi:hypothetical protein